MKIKLWGVRGSLPSPMGTAEYRRKLGRILKRASRRTLDTADQIGSFYHELPPDLKYVFGGNSTCVSVQSNTGNLYILDAGTGIRALGMELMNGACGEGKGEVNLCMTHTHWDHIQGLPFFRPIYVPGNKLNVYSGFDDMEERLTHQQGDERFFPVRFDETQSIKTFTSLQEGKPFQLEDDLTVAIHPLRHPGGSFAYQFMQGGKKFIFATDGEFIGEDMENPGDMEFFEGADLCLLDAQYTLDDAFQKLYWGHTAVTMAVNCGVNWAVKVLVLTHHEPAYDDRRLMATFREALEHRGAVGTDKPRLVLAREGMTFVL